MPTSRALRSATIQKRDTSQELWDCVLELGLTTSLAIELLELTNAKMFLGVSLEPEYLWSVVGRRGGLYDFSRLAGFGNNPSSRSRSARC